VELFIQYADAAGREAWVRATLRQVPGVLSAAPLPAGDGAGGVPLRVEFDPGRTNPIIMRAALARDGFTVLSAADESGPPAGRGRA